MLLSQTWPLLMLAISFYKRPILEKGMKAVDVEFRSAEVVEYFPQLEQVKIKIVLNDGKEKASVKQLKISDPEQLARAWFTELRSKIKQAHSELSLEDHPLANVLVLRFKQEEDVVQEKLMKFFHQVKESIRTGKLAKISYFDLQKKVKSASVKF